VQQACRGVRVDSSANALYDCTPPKTAQALALSRLRVARVSAPSPKADSTAIEAALHGDRNVSSDIITYTEGHDDPALFRRQRASGFGRQASGPDEVCSVLKPAV